MNDELKATLLILAIVLASFYLGALMEADYLSKPQHYADFCNCSHPGVQQHLYLEAANTPTPLMGAETVP